MSSPESRDAPPAAGQPGSGQPGEDERLARGYDRIMQRARELLGGEKGPLPSVHELVERAKQTTVDLGELTRDEAERIGIWLKRDLHDAAQHLRETRSDLRDWLRFDIELVEDRLREHLEVMVDHTRQELDRLATEARAAGEVHTGQVTAPGTLFCQGCGAGMTLKATGHVPPCPKCHGTVFSRAVPVEQPPGHP